MRMQTNQCGVEPLAWSNLVDLYVQRIEERQRRLREDLAYYRARLDELDLTDPQDCTGLRRIYAGHLERISALLHVVS
jgi:hypothetical protein